MLASDRRDSKSEHTCKSSVNLMGNGGMVTVGQLLRTGEGWPATGAAEKTTRQARKAEQENADAQWQEGKFGRMSDENARVMMVVLLEQLFLKLRRIRGFPGNHHHLPTVEVCDIVGRCLISAGIYAVVL